MDMGQSHSRSREAQDHLNIMDVQQDRYLTYLVILDDPMGTTDCSGPPWLWRVMTSHWPP